VHCSAKSLCEITSPAGAARLSVSDDDLPGDQAVCGDAVVGVMLSW